ncbi:MAG TPA: hypothetical protein VI298_07905 [Geobacteraceae bacterium]
MSYRFRVLCFAFIVVLFVGGNYAIWKLRTEVLLTDTRYKGGDLARMGYLFGSKYLRENVDDLPRRHIEFKEYDGRPVDMITIGDSFSNGGGMGKNRFYQDYIATRLHLEVLNIPRHKDIYPLTTASLLNNSGFFDRTKPKYLMIEITETSCFDLAEPVNFDQRLSNEQLNRLKVINYNSPFPKVAFINDGNVKYLLYNALYKISDHAFWGEVYTGKLSSEMFSVPSNNLLLFLRHKRLPTADVVRKMNDNLNTLAERLALKGIKLVFMPCVEKYNLYSKYLIKQPYPSSTLFEELRKLPRRYIWVDTKAILQEELRSGEKDIFYADDTHWSWKASERIVSEMKLD